MMQEKNKTEFNSTEYRLYVGLDENQNQKFIKNTVLRVQSQQGDSSELFLKIKEKEHLKGGFDWVVRDFEKLLSALTIPLKGTAAKAKLFSISVVYALLSPSGLASFFIRGWRLEVIRRMAEGNLGIPIAPSVQSLRDLGEHIRQGIGLLGAKALYDLPKLLVLVAIGYDHFELIVDWTFYFIERISGGANQQTFSNLSSTSFQNLSLNFGIELLFIAIYSVFFSPAFKITMIKYARGNIAYRRFFSLEELANSFKIYRRYKIKTFGAYSWDLLVSSLSMIVGIMLLAFFPIITWIFIPFYKLLFKHWLKAYGYGMLAHRLSMNGEV